MKKLLVAALFLLIAFPAAAQTPDYRVLLPVYYPDPLPGAFGSQWKTAFAMFNPTQTEFHIVYCSFARTMNFGCPLPYISTAQLVPGETQTAFYEDNGRNSYRGPGPRLAYFRKHLQGPSSPSEIQFQLRAADISRSATNAGTEIPVVRPEQFRKTTLNLLNVPVDPKFRLTLRMYETLLPVADFTVRVHDQAQNILLGSADVRLVFQNDHDFISMFNPPYLQIGDLTTLVPAGTQLSSMLRIEIVPRTPGSEFWAFVSITNNETQHLTLVTPQ